MTSIVSASSFVHRGRIALKPSRSAPPSARAANGAAEDVARLLFPERLAHLVIDRRDDRGLDPAARENAEFAVCGLFHALIHKRKPALDLCRMSNSGRPQKCLGLNLTGLDLRALP